MTFSAFSLALPTFALALPRSLPRVVHVNEAEGWLRQPDPVHGSTAVKFVVSLKQRNLDELKVRALSVNTPGSSDYGRFLKAEEVDALTAPTAAHASLVTSWLERHGVAFVRSREVLRVTTTASAASALLATSFATYSDGHGRSFVRASDYSLPADVDDAVSTIFGLHGVPLPVDAAGVAAHSSASVPGTPAKVTPAVIASTYSVGTPYVNRNGTHSQAVAEFQGQRMDKADLTTFFKAEVPKAQPGDDQVSKFVGESYHEGTGVEALLDIEFMMGVSPGVKTEFWSFPATDFCGDLHQYTDTLLNGTDTPTVNSISYGWQGNLTTVGCKPADLAVVDANWAKLAARGFSMMISSGDSGSGYAPPSCQSPSTQKKGVEIKEGTLISSANQDLYECCEMASHAAAKGWTWTAPPTQPLVAAAVSTPVGSGSGATFDGAVFHLEFGDPLTFPAREVHLLSGTLPPTSGGSVSIHSANGTFDDTTMTWSAPWTNFPTQFNFKRNISVTISKAGKKTALGGVADCLLYPGQAEVCTSIQYKTATHVVGDFRAGPNPPPPPPRGNCTLYSAVSKVGPAAKPTTVSGGSAVLPGGSVTLWPSWPASSPWVTAVGATRFVGQVVGGEEMATDQFGSGGGFSKQFDQTDAQWQAKAVAAYVAQGPSLPKFPPAGSFPALGRGTPDVSALGEGYQVYVHGAVQSVGGTSASSPAFAGLVSLINEARIKAGKPQMGFLNPFLYANPDAFFDVVKGTNAIGRGTGNLSYGYAAAKGWDPATGLGTPHFDKLLAAAMKAVGAGDVVEEVA